MKERQRVFYLLTIFLMVLSALMTLSFNLRASDLDSQLITKEDYVTYFEVESPKDRVLSGIEKPQQKELFILELEKSLKELAILNRQTEVKKSL